MKIKNEYHPDYAMPPGEHIKEHIECWGLSKKKFAKNSGIPIGKLNKLLKSEISIDKSIAAKLEHATVINSNMWIALERNYQKIKEKIKRRGNDTSRKNQLDDPLGAQK